MPSPFCVSKRGTRRVKRDAGGSQPRRLNPLSPLNIKGEGWDHSPSFQSLTSQFTTPHQRRNPEQQPPNP